MEILIACIVTALICLVIGFFGGIIYRKKVGESEIGSAEQEAARILDKAEKDAETTKKEALLAAKEEILQQKTEMEKEIKDRRREVSKQEQRLTSKEETLERKMEALEKKDETLNRKIKENESKLEEIEQIKQQHIEQLEKIAQLSAEEAKRELVERVESEARHESAMKLAEIEAQLKEDADEKAKNIISLAIQRCAADHVSEATVSVVPIPSDDMKGRIIGREG